MVIITRSPITIKITTIIIPIVLLLAETVVITVEVNTVTTTIRRNGGHVDTNVFIGSYVEFNCSFIKIKLEYKFHDTREICVCCEQTFFFNGMTTELVRSLTSFCSIIY